MNSTPNAAPTITAAPPAFHRGCHRQETDTEPTSRLRSPEKYPRCVLFLRFASLIRSADRHDAIGATRERSVPTVVLAATSWQRLQFHQESTWTVLSITPEFYGTSRGVCRELKFLQRVISVVLKIVRNRAVKHQRDQSTNRNSFVSSRTWASRSHGVCFSVLVVRASRRYRRASSRSSDEGSRDSTRR